jgi:glycine dehydrogenase subunit 2
VAEADAQPELLREAPHASPVRRLDEASAARQPDLRWRPMTGSEAVCPQ